MPRYGQLLSRASSSNPRSSVVGTRSRLVLVLVEIETTGSRRAMGPHPPSIFGLPSKHRRALKSLQTRPPTASSSSRSPSSFAELQNHQSSTAIHDLIVASRPESLLRISSRRHPVERMGSRASRRRISTGRRRRRRNDPQGRSRSRSRSSSSFVNFVGTRRRVQEGKGEVEGLVGDSNRMGSAHEDATPPPSSSPASCSSRPRRRRGGGYVRVRNHRYRIDFASYASSPVGFNRLEIGRV